jgi:hypothetical protein
VLAAFFLYGIGSVLVDEPIGVVLVAVNSVAVTIVGVIGFRLLRNHNRWVGARYLATRIAEAIFLGGGPLHRVPERQPGSLTPRSVAKLG